MQSKPLEKFHRSERIERVTWQQQYIRNALATLKQIDTRDQTLAEHLLNAEQALRKAEAYVKERSS
jgi:hypothetical protein